MNVLGSGAFGEVWLAQACEINLFQPRDKSEAMVKQRRRLVTRKNTRRKLEEELEKGVKIPVVAIKKLRCKSVCRIPLLIG